MNNIVAGRCHVIYYTLAVVIKAAVFLWCVLSDPRGPGSVLLWFAEVPLPWVFVVAGGWQNLLICWSHPSLSSDALVQHVSNVQACCFNQNSIWMYFLGGVGSLLAPRFRCSLCSTHGCHIEQPRCLNMLRPTLVDPCSCCDGVYLASG